jgi:hypothetical protein
MDELESTRLRGGERNQQTGLARSGHAQGALARRDDVQSGVQWPVLRKLVLARCFELITHDHTAVRQREGGSKVLHRIREASIAVVLPDHRPPLEINVEKRRSSVTSPEERATGLGLIAAVDLDRRMETCAPKRAP